MEVTKVLTLKTKPNIKLKALKGLVIHWTAGLGRNNTADSWKSVWENSSQKGVGAHYAIDAAQLVQYVPEDEVIYHGGGDPGPTYIVNTLFGGKINDYTVGLEICVCDGQDYPTTEKRAIAFCGDFLKAHSLTTDGLWRHFDSTTKPCPLMYIETDKWHKFIDEVKKYMESTEKDKFDKISNIYATDSEFRAFMKERHAYEALTNSYYDNMLWQWSKNFKPDDRGIKAVTEGKVDSNVSAASSIVDTTTPLLNTLHIQNTQVPGGDDSHCVKPENFSNCKLTTKELKVEPIYPDLTVAPGQSTGYFNSSQGSVSQSSNVFFDDLVTEYEARQKIFDPKTYEKEVKKDKGKIINNNDPYSVDEKIAQLEKHHPKVKIDTWEYKTKDCNHPSCSLGNAVKEDVSQIVDVVSEISERTEKRLSALENITATIMRNLFRLSSRVNINCVYYGGQDTFKKYNCIRCLSVDRVNDGQSVSIDQCLSCTRYEPIIGQVYDILDESGMNLSQVLDDTQMSFMNMKDYIEFSRVEEMHKPIDKANFKETIDKNKKVKDSLDKFKTEIIKFLNEKLEKDKTESESKKKVQDEKAAAEQEAAAKGTATTKKEEPAVKTTDTKVEAKLSVKDNLYDIFSNNKFTIDDFGDAAADAAKEEVKADGIPVGAEPSKDGENTSTTADGTNSLKTDAPAASTNGAGIPLESANAINDDKDGTPLNNIVKKKKQILLDKLLYEKLKTVDKEIPELFVNLWEDGFIMDYTMKLWELEQPNVNKYNYNRKDTKTDSDFTEEQQYNDAFVDTREDNASAERFDIKGDNYDTLFPDTTTVDSISTIMGSDVRDKIIAKAKELCDDPNIAYGTDGKRNTRVDGTWYIDCSLFTQLCYSAAGLKIGATTFPQIDQCQPSAGGKIITDIKDALPGDLLFFRFSSRGPEHVELYAGDGKMYGAHNSRLPKEQQVSLRDVYSGYKIGRPAELVKSDASFSSGTPEQFKNIKVDRKMSREEYYKLVSPIAVYLMHKYKIWASFILANSIYEGQGKAEDGNNYPAWSKVAKEGNNVFGIKAYSDWKGKVTTTMATDSPHHFRAYDTIYEAFEDFCKFLTVDDKRGLYADIRNAKSPADAAQYMLNHYDPGNTFRLTILTDILRRGNLEQYDKL